MNSDRAPIRDRTLILRILVPGLEARLRDKMKEAEDEYTSSNHQHQGSSSSSTPAAAMSSSNTPKATTSGGGVGDSILDLEGVTCEPTAARNQTLWSFHCDGATYPAKLVNLPCPVELHKTHDHAAYYKCVDVAQMLIVYEDEMALEEAAGGGGGVAAEGGGGTTFAGNNNSGVEGFPSYHHSGLTPPMYRVVERRFAAREHSAVAPPRQAVQDVETEVLKLMERIALQGETAKGKSSSSSSRGSGNNATIKVPMLTSANKVLEDIVEDVVDYEPWMDDFGRQVTGVEFSADDDQCRLHPEVWLPPDIIRQLREEALAEQEKKRAAEAKKKEKKTQKHHQQKQQQHKPKVNVNKLPKTTPKLEDLVAVDDVTAAAMGNFDDLDMDDGLLDNFEMDGDDLMNLGDLDFTL